MDGLPPPTADTGSSRAPRRAPSDGSAQNPPLGVWVIAILGGLASLIGFLPILGIMASGSAFLFIVGVVLAALNLAQLYVLIGLLDLKSWAWTWAMILFGFSLVADLVTVDIFGFLVSLTIILYLASIADYYD